MGFAARARIPIRHYPQRDPLQLQKRWALRTILASQADPNWKHWQHKDWQDLIATGEEPDLHYWRPGTELPTENSAPHLPKWPKRILQKLIHSGPLRLLDELRPRFPPAWHPKQLPPETVQRIAHAYQMLDDRGGIVPTASCQPAP